MFKLLLDFAKVTRIDSSFMAALIVMLPVSLTTHHLINGALLALPIFTASMGGFILNDIHDVEKDTINHPARPIAIGAISKSCAMAMYFVLLAMTLALIRIQPISQVTYMYLLFIILFANYNYAVERFPKTKNLYVAATTTIPVLIVIWSLGLENSRLLVVLSVLFFVSGRELLMDVLDQKGDGDTLAKAIGAERSVPLGFGLQLVASLCLLPLTSTIEKKAVVFVMLIGVTGLFFVWQHVPYRKWVIFFMKVIIMPGIIFLLP